MTTNEKFSAGNSRVHAVQFPRLLLMFFVAAAAICHGQTPLDLSFENDGQVRRFLFVDQTGRARPVDCGFINTAPFNRLVADGFVSDSLRNKRFLFKWGDTGQAVTDTALIPILFDTYSTRLYIEGGATYVDVLLGDLLEIEFEKNRLAAMSAVELGADFSFKLAGAAFFVKAAAAAGIPVSTITAPQLLTTTAKSQAMGLLNPLKIAVDVLLDGKWQRAYIYGVYQTVEGAVQTQLIYLGTSRLLDMDEFSNADAAYFRAAKEIHESYYDPTFLTEWRTATFQEVLTEPAHFALKSATFGFLEEAQNIEYARMLYDYIEVGGVRLLEQSVQWTPFLEYGKEGAALAFAIDKASQLPAQLSLETLPVFQKVIQYNSSVKQRRALARQTRDTFLRVRSEFHQTLLNALAKPDRIANLTATPQADGTILLSWLCPTANLGTGGQVDHYRLQYSDAAFNPNTVNLHMVGWAAGQNGMFRAIAAPGQTETITFSPDRTKIHAGQTCHLALAAYDDLEGVGNRSSIALTSVVVPTNPTGIELVNLRVDPSASQQGAKLYTYSAKYAHVNNAPPQAGWPKLFIDGVEAPGGIQQIGNDYRTGVAFSYQTTRDFTVGVHNFTWEMKADGVTRSVTNSGPDITGYLSGSGARRINGNTYLFFTTWRDAQGRIPDSAKLYRRYGATKVDIADMRFKGGEPVTGMRYEFGPWTLHHETDYRYYFEFRVGGTIYRDPPNPADFYTGLVTEHIVDVAVRNLRFEPPKLVGGQTATILVDLFNFGSNRETNLIVRARINGVQLGNPVTVSELTWAGTAGNYREKVPFSWSMPQGDNASNYLVSVAVDARPGETLTTNNTLQAAVTVTPPPGSISGYVLDFQGNPIKGAAVKIVAGSEFGSTESGAFSRSGTETNPDGFFKISGLPPGTYALEASASGNVMKLQNIAVHAGVETANQNFQFGSGAGQQITNPTLSSEHHTNPSWSPSGNRVVFQTSKIATYGFPQILIQSADGSGTPTRLTGPDKVSGSLGADSGDDPEWSPDGARILFHGEHPQGNGHTRGIFVANASGNGTDAAFVVLDAGLSTGHPTWSPDSQRFAYYNTSGTWIYSFGTGTSTKLSDSAVTTLAWSPDGTKIAGDGNILSATNGIVLYSYSGNWPSWLRDSSGIVYQRGDDIYARLLVDFGQEIPVLTAGGVHEWTPAVSPNGTNLCFASNRGLASGLDALFVIPFSFDRLLIKSFQVSNMFFTPNGDGSNDTVTLTYKLATAANVTAKVYASDGSLTRKLVLNSPQSAGTNQLVWDATDEQGRLAKDGIYHLTLDARDAAGNVSFPQIARLNLAEGITTPIVRDAALSHDGARIAFRRNTGGLKQVVLSALTGAGEVILYSPPGTLPTAEQRIDWAYDDSAICFVDLAQELQIFVVGTNGSGLTQLTFSTDDGIGFAGSFKPAWSPTRKEIAYIAKHARGTSQTRYFAYNIFVMNGDGSGKRQVTNFDDDRLNNNTFALWTGDGERILFSIPEGTSSGQHDIWIIGRTGGAPSRLTQHPFADLYAFGMPDSDQFGWLSQRQTSSAGPLDLWIQHLDGTAKWALWMEASPNSNYRVLPGGFRIWNGVGTFLNLFQSVSLGQIIGLVVEPGTNGVSPVAGALVQAIAGTNVIGEAFSGANGQFQVFNLPPSSYTVVASKVGYRSINAVSNRVVQANVVSDIGAMTLLRLPDVALTIDRASTHVRGEVVLHAEPIGGTVASVEFSYSLTGSNSWTRIGTVASAPFELVWDTTPLVVAGQERPVFVRAIARDAAARTDDELPVLNLTLDGVAPKASATLATAGSVLPPGSLIGISAVHSNADLTTIIFELRRRGETEWRSLSAASIPNLSGVLDTGDLVGGQTYELRARGIDGAGNTDLSAAPLTFSVAALVSLGIASVKNEVVLSWPTNGGIFVLEGTTNLASNRVWSAVLPSPSVVGDANVVTNSRTGAARFYRLRTP